MIEVMKQALEALELTADRMQKQRDAITFLRQAIEQAEKREWVGLTLDEKEEYLAQDFGGSRADAMDWADKRLKEKNCG
jgi:DNA repair protein RadC